MKILINLMGFTKGGAQQVGMNFVSVLKQHDFKDFEFHYYVSEGTLMAELLKDVKHLVVVKNKTIIRLLNERCLIAKYIRKHDIDIIFCLFGLKINAPVPCIIGSALSNIYFPEIDFWHKLPLQKRLFKRLKDKYRLKYTLSADAIIFENESMRKRAINLFKYPSSKTTFIKPSISNTNDITNNDAICNRCQLLPKGYKVLMLTGWHRNKNIEIVPYVLRELAKYKSDFYFILSIDENERLSKKLINVAKQLGVDKNIVFFRSVLPFEVETLVKNCDVVALFSLLESFSNNIIEAWAYNRALLISEEEWAHSICHDAAEYCDRNDAIDIAKKILKLRCNKDYYGNLIKNGQKEIKTYPSPEQKVKYQLEFIKKIFNHEQI